MLSHFFPQVEVCCDVSFGLVTWTYWRSPRHLSLTLPFMSLVNLHTRVSVCRGGNKTHLEKALSFSDFRAQSHHTACHSVRERMVLYLAMISAALPGAPQQLISEDVWRVVNSYLFQDIEEKTGTEGLSTSSFTGPERNW